MEWLFGDRKGWLQYRLLYFYLYFFPFLSDNQLDYISQLLLEVNRVTWQFSSQWNEREENNVSPCQAWARKTARFPTLALPLSAGFLPMPRATSEATCCRWYSTNLNSWMTDAELPNSTDGTSGQWEMNFFVKPLRCEAVFHRNEKLFNNILWEEHSGKSKSMSVTISPVSLLLACFWADAWFPFFTKVCLIPLPKTHPTNNLCKQKN